MGRKGGQEQKIRKKLSSYHWEMKSVLLTSSFHTGHGHLFLALKCLSSAVIDQVKTQGWSNPNSAQLPSPLCLTSTKTDCSSSGRSHFLASFVPCSNLWWNIINNINIQWRRIGFHLSLWKLIIRGLISSDKDGFIYEHAQLWAPSLTGIQ